MWQQPVLLPVILSQDSHTVSYCACGNLRAQAGGLPESSDDGGELQRASIRDTFADVSFTLGRFFQRFQSYLIVPAAWRECVFPCEPAPAPGPAQ